MNDNITIEELNEELKKYELKNIYVDLFSIGRFNVEKSLIKVTYKNFYKYEYVPNTRSPEARESLKIFLYGENNEEAEDEDDFHTIAYSLGIVYVDASSILGYDDKDKDLPVLAQYNVFKPMLLDDENIKSEEKSSTKTKQENSIYNNEKEEITGERFLEFSKSMEKK